MTNTNTTLAAFQNPDLTFGVEIETYLASGSRYDLAVKVAGDVFPGATVAYGVGMGRVLLTAADGRVWTFMSDASIEGGVECEIVSPVLTLADMATVQNVARSAKRHGAKINASCGIHVHVGAKPLYERGPAAFANLINLWGRFEALTLPHVVDRPGTRWARPMNARLRDAAKAGKIKSDLDLRTAWYGTADSYAHTSHYDSSRYAALNLHNLWFRSGNARTVEFRCFNGTLHAGKIRAYVTLCLAVVGHAVAARHVRRDDRAFDLEWTGYAIVQLFKTVGLTGSHSGLAAVRAHLSALGKGHSGHASPARCLAWAVRHGRNVDAIVWPASFDVAAERARLAL